MIIITYQRCISSGLLAKDNHVTSEDLARLLPLVFEHINLLGPLRFLCPGGSYSG